MRINLLVFFIFFLSTNPMKGPKPSVSLSLNTSILCLFHSAPSPLVATEDVHLLKPLRNILFNLKKTQLFPKMAGHFSF